MSGPPSAGAPPPPSRQGSMTGSTGMASSATPGASGAGGGGQTVSNQNLNQIVLEYLNKKGYSKTEATLRRESARQDADGKPIYASFNEMGGRKYAEAYQLAKQWILDDNLEIYKAELKRLLWPLFVYSFLELVGDYYPKEAERFFSLFKDMFQPEHEDDIRALAPIALPEHAQDNEIAKVYRGDKYRVSLTTMAFTSLIQFLESKEHEGGTVILNLIQHHLHVRTVDRATAGQEKTLAALLARGLGDDDLPAEDEGIPGHNPGSANTDRNAPNVLAKLSLGKLPPEQELMEDVMADLEARDKKDPPAPGQKSLVEEYEQSIKVEPDEDAPTREIVPLPPSTVRDIAMEVQKVKENRDRFPIPGRTGGIGPGVSVCMFTFHNTFDTINCLEFSDDQLLVAAGTSESYIRIWSLDGEPLPSAIVSTADNANPQPSASRRLIGHSGPVYALTFSPSTASPVDPPAPITSASSTRPRILLSSSADKTIRLWDLSTYSCLVIYRSHDAPIWSLSFSPYGHYFLSGSHDRTARLWSTDHIAPLRVFAGHDSDVESVTWHPNGSYVFTAGGAPDRTVRMWSVNTGSAVRLFTGHTGSVTALACSPNGKILASGDDAGNIFLWDLNPGRRIKRMRGHAKGGIWSLAWSAESSVLVSGGADETIRVWDVLLATGDAGAGVSVGGKPAGGAGDASKGDGGALTTTATATTTTTTTTTSAGTQGKKLGKSKDAVVTQDQISVFMTKSSPVYKVAFTRMNLVMAASAYLP